MENDALDLENIAEDEDGLFDRIAMTFQGGMSQVKRVEISVARLM